MYSISYNINLQPFPLIGLILPTPLTALGCLYLSCAALLLTDTFLPIGSSVRFAAPYFLMRPIWACLVHSIPPFQDCAGFPLPFVLQAQACLQALPPECHSSCCCRRG